MFLYDMLGDTSARDDVSSGSSGDRAPGPLTGTAPLPPIGQTYTQLTPIGEASREHTQAYSLKVQEGMSQCLHFLLLKF